MHSGFEYVLPGGGDVRVRRCYGDAGEVVEFSIETGSEPIYSQVHLCLSPEQAALIGSFLAHEAAVPIVRAGNA